MWRRWRRSAVVVASGHKIAAASDVDNCREILAICRWTPAVPASLARTWPPASPLYLWDRLSYAQSCSIIKPPATSSSAVAEMPRDASCLSVFSFSSTILQAQPFISSYFGFIFTNQYNKIMFCWLQRNVESSCHKQDSQIRNASSSVFCNQKKHRRLMLPAMSVTNLPRSGGTLFIIPDGRTVDNMRWSEIIVENNNVFMSQLHLTPLLGCTRCSIAIMLGMEKLERCGYPMVKKMMIGLLALQLHERDRRSDWQTDWQTPHDSKNVIPRGHTPRGLNCGLWLLRGWEF